MDGIEVSVAAEEAAGTVEALAADVVVKDVEIEEMVEFRAGAKLLTQCFL